MSKLGAVAFGFGVALASLSLPAYACSPRQTVELFEVDWDVPDLRTDVIPAPTIGKIEFTRGTQSAGSSCADMGAVSIMVSLPETFQTKIGDIGVAFLAVKGEDTYEYFQGIPLVPFEGEEAYEIEVFLPWLDGAPHEQHVIDLEVEAFFVTREGAEGPRTRFSLYSKPHAP